MKMISTRYLFNTIFCICITLGFVEFSWPFIEVIIDAYVEAGLVLERDAKQNLKVFKTLHLSSLSTSPPI